jgi:glutamyl-tRNA(Gln) amidotransferase subunit E
VEGHFKPAAEFNYKIVYALLRFVKQEGLEMEIAKKMLPVVYQHPKMDFESVLISIKFKRISHEQILSQVPYLRKKFAEIRNSSDGIAEEHWIMGQVRRSAEGNVPLGQLASEIKVIN